MVAKDPKKIKHIRCTEFENDVVKLRNNEEAKLTPRGKEALNIFYFQVIRIFHQIMIVK